LRVLIIGLDTPIGQALAVLLRLRGREVVGFSRSDARWHRERHAKKDLRSSSAGLVVDLRVHAARDADALLADTDMESIAWIAKSCQSINTPLLLLGSARVFSGLDRRPYFETDPCDGDDAVAGQLREVEEKVRSYCERHVILRAGPAFSHYGTNVLTTTLAELLAGNALNLDASSRFAPAAADDLARVISAMLDQYSVGLDSWGVFHYVSTEQASAYEFAEAALAATSQFVALQDAPALRSVDADTPPRSRSLDCGRLRSTFAIRQLPWRGYVAPAVRMYFDALKSEKTA